MYLYTDQSVYNFLLSILYHNKFIQFWVDQIHFASYLEKSHDCYFCGLLVIVIESNDFDCSGSLASFNTTSLRGWRQWFEILYISWSCVKIGLLEDKYIRGDLNLIKSNSWVWGKMLVHIQGGCLVTGGGKFLSLWVCLCPLLCSQWQFLTSTHHLMLGIKCKLILSHLINKMSLVVIS